MKRREFLKGMGLVAIIPFMPSIPINSYSVEVNQTGYELFMNSIIDHICVDNDIPRAVFDMEFSKGYSLSKEVLLNGCNKAKGTKLI